MAATQQTGSQTGNRSRRNVIKSDDATTQATMIFDTNTRVVNDPGAAIRKYWSQNPARSDADD